MFIVFDLDGTLRSTAGSEHLVPANVTRTENWLPWQGYVNRNGKRIEPVVALYYQCVTTPTLILTSFGLVFTVLCGFFGFIYLVLRGSLNESQ